jgi:hypothetical protein
MKNNKFTVTEKSRKFTDIAISGFKNIFSQKNINGVIFILSQLFPKQIGTIYLRFTIHQN